MNELAFFEPVPVGSILMWPTNTPPEDWLLVNGSTFSAATYPELNTLLGSTTLPDFRFRFPLGAYPDAPFFTNSFVLGGSATHTHTQPTHTHTGPDHNHTIAHTHAVDPPNTASTSAGTHTHDSHTTAQVGILGLLSSGLNGPTTHSSTGTAHTHNVDIASFTSGASSAADSGNAGTGNTGASGGDVTGATNHNPPFITVNFIIKAR